MIIPVRCFSCNKILASKYSTYKRLNEEMNFSNDDIVSSLNDVKAFQQNLAKSSEIFNKLGVDRYCCKKHLLTHVELIEKI